MPKSPIERRLERLHQAKTYLTKRYYSTNRKEDRKEERKEEHKENASMLMLPNMPKRWLLRDYKRSLLSDNSKNEAEYSPDAIKAINNSIIGGKLNKSYIESNKPIFVISTKNKKWINKKCFIGKLIDDVQRRIPPVEYKANRGDNSIVNVITRRANASPISLHDVNESIEKTTESISRKLYDMVLKKDMMLNLKKTQLPD